MLIHASTMMDTVLFVLGSHTRPETKYVAHRHNDILAAKTSRTSVASHNLAVLAGEDGGKSAHRDDLQQWNSRSEIQTPPQKTDTSQLQSITEKRITLQLPPALP